MTGLALRRLLAEIENQNPITAMGLYDAVVYDVITDSRKVVPGTLFIAIKGEKFDGHTFVRRAFESGAAAVVAEADKLSELSAGLAPEQLGRVVAVQDSVKALGSIAAAYRRELKMPVVGITGSVGKTTTKNMTAAALAPLGSVTATKLNFNNEIGLPLTILSAEPSDSALVGEMGMRGTGEIKYLTEILKPDIGIITNIGISHIERLGSRENIMKAKTEICAGLPYGATLLVGESDYPLENLAAEAESYGKAINVKSAGISEGCDYYAADISMDDEGCMHFTFMPEGTRVNLSLSGMHHVKNAVVALAAAVELGVPAEAAAESLSEFKGDNIRQHLLKKKNMSVIDDTYNAGPESMLAALDVLKMQRGADIKIAVLGSMLELGSASDDAHLNVLRAAEATADEIILIGDTWPETDREAGAAEKGNVKRYANWKAALPEIDEMLNKYDAENMRPCFLVKGSHAMELENIVSFLEDKSE